MKGFIHELCINQCCIDIIDIYITCEYHIDLIPIYDLYYIIFAVKSHSHDPSE